MEKKILKCELSITFRSRKGIHRYNVRDVIWQTLKFRKPIPFHGTAHKGSSCRPDLFVLVDAVEPTSALAMTRAICRLDFKTSRCCAEEHGGESIAIAFDDLIDGKRTLAEVTLFRPVDRENVG